MATFSIKHDIKRIMLEEKEIFYSILATVLISIYLVTSHTNGSLGDAGYYISNGERLFEGENAYEDGFRSGPLGAIYLYVLSLIFAQPLLELILQFCNIAGPILFVTLLFSDKRQAIKYWPILIMFSAFRELLVNHQINGFILVLLSMFLISRKSEKLHVNLVGNFAAVLALDLKPHLVIPIILSLTLLKRDWINLLRIVAITTMLHISINIHLKTITEIQWVQNLREISNAPGNSDWADIFNVWPLIDEVIDAPEVLKVIALSTFFVLCLALPTISKKTSANTGTYIALATPLIGVYAHFYDLVPFLLISFLYLEKYSDQAYFWFFVNCALIFRGVDSLNEVIFLTVANSFLLGLSIRDRYLKKARILKSIICGSALYLVFHELTENLITDENILRSFLISFIGFVTFVSTIKKISRKQGVVK
jgi:hypothetical protein